MRDSPRDSMMESMTWTLTGSIDEYLARAGDYLRARPIKHTIELAAAETLLARGPAAFGSQAPLLGWWRSSAGEVAASAFHTAPYPLLLSGSSEAAGPLAAELARRAQPLPGVNSEADLAMSFATAWRERTGAGSALHRRSRLFHLGELTAPSPMPPGSARIANEADSSLLVRWEDDFSDELADLADQVASRVADWLSYGGLTLWEVDGAPVAMAGNGRPAAGVVRVGPVFTPREHRRRGYGAAVTAAVSQAVMTAGAAAVVLFTDLANPTSNALYPRLGYQPVADRVVLAFGPATYS